MRVVLGVGGGIAAYKSAELARRLQERGCTVQVVMTAAAQQFIQPLTFAALTSNKVITGLWSSASPEDTLSSAVANQSGFMQMMTTSHVSKLAVCIHKDKDGQVDALNLGSAVMMISAKEQKKKDAAEKKDLSRRLVMLFSS